MNDERRREDQGSAQPLEDIAIIGMACVFPGAPDIEAYWHNIVSKKDAICDPPTDSWDATALFDPDSNADDRVYCKRGGYLGPLARFDPLEHGIPPIVSQGGEPEQWVALSVAKQAFDDAGFASGAPDPARAAVILGKGDYVNRGNLSVLQHAGFVDQTLEIIHSLNPELTKEDLASIRADLKRELPAFNADTVSGIIPNIAAGRIANRLNLMGPSYTVDAACASSLIATDMAVKELRDRRSDLVLVGGMHIALPMQIREVFCRLDALSRSQRIRPFDKDADGTILGEGVGMMVLQRRDDAERDGKRIYAIIKGLGTASDGQGMSVMAPRREGEVLALQRAYAESGIDPESIGLIEAHGTGTLVGDATEIDALNEFFGDRSGSMPHCALGSVKSMIGHLMPAAGVAAMIKTALALYHRVLPPTLGVDDPHPNLTDETTRFYLNTETRPWIHDGSRVPRRAGVNAFGFGGINAHAILEEVSDAPRVGVETRPAAQQSEIVLIRGASREELHTRAGRVLAFAKSAPDARLADLAYTVGVADKESGSSVLSVVATSLEDLAAKLEKALPKLADPKCAQIKNQRGGIYFASEPLASAGKVAYLFPGEGSQYPNMLAELCVHFPEARSRFESTERGFARAGVDERPSAAFFPPSRGSSQDRKWGEEWLWNMRGAVTAVLTADYAVLTVLEKLKIETAALIGHSTGEFPALIASGMIDLFASDRTDAFTLELHELFHKLEKSESEMPRAALVAVGGDSKVVTEILEQVGGDLRIAMDNCPHQAVIAGAPEVVDEAVKRMQTKGLICERLEFDRPYHTPHFEPFAKQMRGFFERWIDSPPRIPTYTCGTKGLFGDDVEANRTIAAEQWMQPVAFRETIEKMFEDGIRVFVEVGARGNLSAFVDDILRGKPHLAAPADVENRSSLTQLHHLVGMLAAHGVPVDLEYLYAHRNVRRCDLDAAPEGPESAAAERRTKLETGWPVMQLSQETLDELSNRLSAAKEDLPAAAAVPPADVSKRDEVVQPPSAPSAHPILSAHFEAMQRFIQLNTNVMQDYLARRRTISGTERAGSSDPTGREESGPDKTERALPLLGEVVKRDVSSLVVARRLDPEHDLYLKHHTFGRRVSISDPTLLGMPVVPLTVSIEMIAEAGSLLAPGKHLIGFRNVRGSRWLTTEYGHLDVRIEVERMGSETGKSEAETSVKVQVFESSTTGGTAGFEIPLIEGEVVFGEYAVPPEAGEFEIKGVRRAKWAPDRIYEDVMFHEPLMQGVRSIDSIGEDGATATIDVLPTAGLVRDDDDPAFLTDPVLLDQVGQVVGYWAKEHWGTDVFFPFQIEQLELFGPPLPPGESVICRAKVEVVDADQTRADMDVVRRDGTLWCRVIGWWDRRFTVTNKICAYYLSPGDVMLSDATEPDPGAESRELEVANIGADSFPSDFFTSAGGMLRRALAAATLSRKERPEWVALQAPVPQQVRWLLQRIVAKDSVRRVTSIVTAAGRFAPPISSSRRKVEMVSPRS